MQRRVWHSRRLPSDPGTESLPPSHPTSEFPCRAHPSTRTPGTIDLPANPSPIPVYEVPDPRLYESTRRVHRPSGRRATAATRPSEGLDLRSTRIARETCLPRPSTAVRVRACKSVKASRQANEGAPPSGAKVLRPFGVVGIAKLLELPTPPRTPKMGESCGP